MVYLNNTRPTKWNTINLNTIAVDIQNCKKLGGGKIDLSQSKAPVQWFESSSAGSAMRKRLRRFSTSSLRVPKFSVDESK
jgi:hypothetical protein